MSGTTKLVDLGENITNQAFQSSASANDERDYLSDLPLEMLDMIINNMDLTNALKMGKTSKLYYNLIQNNETRRNKLCQKEFLTDYSKPGLEIELNRMCLFEYPFLNSKQKFCTKKSNICKFVFGDFSKLEKLNSNNLDGTYTIPEYVKVVTDSRVHFYKAPKDVKILHIPPSVQAIYNLGPVRDSLEKITGMQNVRKIEEGLFRNFTSLTSVILPDSITSIPIEAFQSCRSLASIIIPDSVRGIGHRAFRDCTSLASITIPDSVTYIGSLAFYGCDSLASITIPDSVRHIGTDAFIFCTSLASITIPDSVTYIGHGAFWGCTSLTSITIPATFKDGWENRFSKPIEEYDVTFT